jgi:DNA-binding NtrC family response regulator
MFDAASIRSFWRAEREGACVLVVDDEPSICDALQFALEEFDLRVRTAGSAEDAINLLGSQHLELVVTDKNLPDKSGLEILACIQELGLKVPAVMITGYASMDTVSAALEAGAIDYIAKPFDDILAVAAKLAAIVERRIKLRVCERIAQSLLQGVQVRDNKMPLSDAITEKLTGFKKQLSIEPDVLVYDDTQTGTALYEGLEDAGLSVVRAQSAEQINQMISSNPTLQVAVMTMDNEDSIEVISNTKLSRPRMVVVLSSAMPELRRTLHALELGASDMFFSAHETTATFAARIQHRIRGTQREQLYSNLFATLYMHSDLVDSSFIDLISEIDPEPRVEA